MARANRLQRSHGTDGHGDATWRWQSSTRFQCFNGAMALLAMVTSDPLHQRAYVGWLQRGHGTDDHGDGWSARRAAQRPCFNGAIAPMTMVTDRRYRVKDGQHA